MTKVFLALAILIMCCSSATAQPVNKYSKLIKARAEKMCAAMISRNYTEFIKFMPLTLIKSLGDKQAIIDNMDKGDREMLIKGFRFEKVIIGEPGEIVDTANTLQCLVPQTILISTPQNSQIKNQSYTLAISWDRGVTWFFSGINPKNADMLKRVYPVLSSRMMPPESKIEVME